MATMSFPRICSRRPWLLGLLLFGGTVLLYARSLGFEFVNYDDSRYVYNNPAVSAGLTWSSVVWAFTGAGDLWNPLTRLSHILDGQLFGLAPWGHHLTSILWHAINGVLCWWVLHRLTGSLWRSALCAALFAWHPLHVESVSWVSERKDVLSGFFFLCTLGSYLGYVERRRAAAAGAGWRYGRTLLLFLCGLMAKPMLVTLPGVLLLVDFWPLRRVGFGGAAVPAPRESWRAVLLEKIPFVALAGLFSAVTLRTQEAAGDFVLQLPLGDRLGNAVVAVARYLGKTVWPFDLVVAYPHPGTWPLLVVGGALALTLAITGLALWQWRQRPWLVVGWLFFLGTLVPVLGLVQVGFQSIADRYTYIPSLGLGVALVWMVGGRGLDRRWWAVLSGLVLIGCGVRTWDQQGCWRDSRALYEHALASSPDNAVAHGFLGYTLCRFGHLAEAEQHCRQALALNPRSELALSTLALVLEKQGRLDEAAAAYRAALEAIPGKADNAHALGLLLLRQGRPAEALPYLQRAVEGAPTRGDYLLACAEAEATGINPDAGIRRLEAAVAREPDNPAFRNSLALLLGRYGHGERAVQEFARAVALDPAVGVLRANYAAALLAVNQFDEACAQYRQALVLDPKDASIPLGLGLALVQHGQEEAALAQFDAALRLAPDLVPANLESGFLLLRGNQPQKAAERLRRAVGGAPGLARAHLGLALACERLGLRPEASVHFEQAIRCAPTDPANHSAWAEALARRGQFAEAVAPYAEAIRLQPEEARTHAALGYVFYLLKRRDEARREWAEALRLQPDFPGLRERLDAL